MDELLDLVDTSDQVIGQMMRSEIYEKGLHNFRVINAFLMNDKKQLWIPTRSAHKRLFPSCLDVSVGGHVAAGEGYNEAFAREAQEEVNLDISHYAYERIAQLTPHEHGVSAFMQLYVMRINSVPNFNKDDFTQASWLSFEELQSRLKVGVPAKGDLPILLNTCQIKFK